MILCLEPQERGIYEVLAPLYFPRDILEESSALWQLPRDIGGTFGEPQIVERQIRIIHNPQHSVMISGKCVYVFGMWRSRRFADLGRIRTKLLLSCLWIVLDFGEGHFNRRIRSNNDSLITQPFHQRYTISKQTIATSIFTVNYCYNYCSSFLFYFFFFFWLNGIGWQQKLIGFIP